MAGVAIGLGAATFFGGHKILKNRVEHRASLVNIERIISNNPSINNPKLMSKIVNIYGWNPSTSNGLARINFVNEVSKRAGISPAKVMFTIEKNSFDKHHFLALKNRLNHLKGVDSNYAERVNRIISVLNVCLKVDPKLSIELANEIKSKRGSVNKIKKLVEQE